jgi:hypothetical protein
LHASCSNLVVGWTHSQAPGPNLASRFYIACECLLHTLCARHLAFPLPVPIRGAGIDTVVMPYDERDDRSRFTKSYPDQAFLDAVSERELPSTADVADAVGCSVDTALKRLRRLEEKQMVASAKRGNANIWRRPD